MESYCIYTFEFQTFLFLRRQAKSTALLLPFLCSVVNEGFQLEMISLMCHLAVLCIVGMVICSFHLLDSVEGEPWFPSQDSHLKSGCCSALQVDTWCAIVCYPWAPLVLLLDHSLAQGMLKFFVAWILAWKVQKKFRICRLPLCKD